ncbi:MAG: Trk system potassium transporter TrkA [Treponema sp.]|nr:Trk system potassium transporter TrkA [Treponema sp.]
MKIVIIGAGFTGVQLAKRLINEKNDVILIDNDEETVRHASNRLDCAVVQADGNSLQTLEDNGIAKAAALVCVTDNDEVNMITCSLVDAVYPDILKIARVRNYAYYLNSSVASKKYSVQNNKKHRPLYGIDYMIHPDVEAAKVIVEAVKNGAVNDVLPFGNGDFELARLTIETGSLLAGKQLQNVRSLTDKPFLITYVESNGKTSLPSGTTTLNPGDSIGLLTKTENLHELFGLCGSKIQELKKVALVGAGRIGTIVADQIFQHKKNSFLYKFFNKQNSHHLLIVDEDGDAAKIAADKFPDASVFCADVTDEAFIQEEGLQNYDLVICTTRNHELNMVVAAYLESLGVGKTISLVASSAYATIARKIGVDVPVPIRDVVVDSIMSHLRGSSVTEIHTVTTGELEIVECVLSASSPVVGKALKDISSAGIFLILLIQPNGSSSYQIPVGSTILSTGDKITLITLAEKTKDILVHFNGKNQ